jgi:archaellin
MRFIILLSFVIISSSLFAQQKSTHVKPSSLIKSQQVVGDAENKTNLKSEKATYHVKLSSSGNAGVTNTLTPEQEIESCMKHLESLDVKEAYLRANNSDMTTPELAKWLNDANATRASLNQRIESLR